MLLKTHDDLLCHYGSQHKLNDKYLEDELSKVNNKKLNGHSNGKEKKLKRNPKPSNNVRSRRKTASSTASEASEDDTDSIEVSI